jgi:hypothetical protein
MAEGQINRFKGVPDKIAAEIEVYENEYFKEDKPIPFIGTLSLYPATVHDYEIFSNCSTCLTLNKNETVEGLRMSHLEYLYTKTLQPGQEGAAWSFRLQKLFELIFHIKNGIKCKKCGRVIEYTSPEFAEYISKVQEAQQNKQEIPPLVCPEEGCASTGFIEMMKFIEDPNNPKKHVLCVNGQIIDKDAYDRLRYIVLFQNFPDYRDDSWVDPEIKKDHDEKMRLERQNNDVHATLEKKIVCLSVATGLELEYIYGMTIRKFTMSLMTVDDLINYKINRTASLSGFIQWPKDHPIEHWIYKPDKDMYGESYKSLSQATKEAS